MPRSNQTASGVALRDAVPGKALVARRLLGGLPSSVGHAGDPLRRLYPPQSRQRWRSERAELLSRDLLRARVEGPDGLQEQHLGLDGTLDRADTVLGAPLENGSHVLPFGLTGHREDGGGHRQANACRQHDGSEAGLSQRPGRPPCLVSDGPANHGTAPRLDAKLAGESQPLSQFMPPGRPAPLSGSRLERS